MVEDHNRGKKMRMKSRRGEKLCGAGCRVRVESFFDGVALLSQCTLIPSQWKMFQ